ELAGEQRADGGLAGAHEACESEDGETRNGHRWIGGSLTGASFPQGLKPTLQRLNTWGLKPPPPEEWEVEASRASGCELYHCSKRGRPWRGRRRQCRRGPW